MASSAATHRRQPARRSVWRCCHSEGPTSGRRITKATAQRQKARVKGGMSPVKARATSELPAQNRLARARPSQASTTVRLTKCSRYGDAPPGSRLAERTQTVLRRQLLHAADGDV